MPEVKVYSAGTHFHADPGDAPDVLGEFLEHCGYTKYVWKCRIDKMNTSHPEARPVRVVGWKPYGITLRVKPNLNSNTDQQMTLEIPDGSGYSPSKVFDQLSSAEKPFGRKYRQEFHMTKASKLKAEEQTAPVQHSIPLVTSHMQLPRILEAVPPVEPELPAPEFKNLKNIIRNKEKLHYALEKLHFTFVLASYSQRLTLSTL